MLITRFSKDSKRGFAVGSNSLTPQKLAAGAVTLAAGLTVAAIGGLVRISRSDKKPRKTKKPPIWLAAAPLVYGAAKTHIENKFLNDIAAQAGEAVKPDDIVEIINAESIPPEADVCESI